MNRLESTTCFLATPVVGFGWLCVVGTILYRFQISPHSVSIILVVAAVGIGGSELARLKSFQRIALSRRDYLLSGVFLGVVAFSLLPAVLGGPQFSLFQGNVVDQFNHLALAISVDHYEYDFLRSVPLEKGNQNDFLLLASYVFGTRPGVNIGYAILSHTMFGHMYEKIYLFIAFLQILFFLSITTLIINILELRPLVAAVVGAACALGFFVQYVIDINAWSHLAGMALAVFALTTTVLIFTSPDDAHQTPQILLKNGSIVGLAWAPVIYVYPEIFLAYGLALTTGILIYAIVSREWNPKKFLALGVGGLVVVLVAAFSWKNTAGVLEQQLALALHIPIAIPNFANSASVGSTVEIGWHKYFQRYLFDQSLSEQGYRSWYAIISWPADFMYGAIGLYFVRPPADLALIMRVGWKLLLWIPLVILFYGAGVAGLRIVRDRKPTTILCFTMVALISLVFPIALASQGLYWTAGKGLAMIAPLMFGLLVLPLATESGRHLRKHSVIWAYVFLSLAFGLFRPVAALTPSGIHYSAPYPAVSNGALKLTIDWNIAGVLDQSRICKKLVIKISNPFLDSFVQSALTERNAQWSTLQPIDTYYGMGRTFAPPPRPNDADCGLFSYVDPDTAHMRLGLLALNAAAGVATGLPIKSTRLEIAHGLDAEIGATGLYEAEVYESKPLRWTKESAKFVVPAALWSSAERMSISIKLWGISPADGTPFRLVVNGIEVLAGTVQGQPVVRKIEVPASTDAGPLRIQLESRTFSPPGDTRKLGVAIESIELAR
jgi:hypothetical protein